MATPSAAAENSPLVRLNDRLIIRHVVGNVNELADVAKKLIFTLK